MATYTKLSIHATEEQGEILAAYLAEFPFDSFDYADGLSNAYIPQSELEGCRADIERLLEEEGIIDYYFEDIEAQNWNALWESNFEEVEVRDRVLIRAPFHKARPHYKGLEVIIQPKMSFGTGHHATTQLMVEMLLNSHLEGKRILDMGSGTGVLAIVAAKLGAQSVLAVEIDDMAEESVRENISLNAVESSITSICGDAKAIEGEKFDIVLANINRNVLLADMEQYAATLSSGGELIMSGFLAEDVPMLLKKAKSLGMRKTKQLSHDEWQVIRVIK
ncbi:MAG: 50S ribosomal protein L11 methyltransferase [Alistipes sp.]|nr:50S ribosomal protein L11 methyltransferase [Alistipes sp.]